MGSDFTYAIVPLCNPTEERIKQLHFVVDATTDDHLKECARDGGDGLPSEYRDRLHDLVNSYPFDSREVGELRVRGCAYVITGGMSCGDPPTESYEDIADLGSVDTIWNALERWAVEDVKAEVAP